MVHLYSRHNPLIDLGTWEGQIGVIFRAVVLILWPNIRTSIEELPEGFFFNRF